MCEVFYLKHFIVHATSHVISNRFPHCGWLYFDHSFAQETAKIKRKNFNPQNKQLYQRGAPTLQAFLTQNSNTGKKIPNSTLKNVAN